MFWPRHLLVLAARAHQQQRRHVHRHTHAHAAEEELFDRIWLEGLAIVAADVGLDPHELLVGLLRRTLH